MDFTDMEYWLYWSNTIVKKWYRCGLFISFTTPDLCCGTFSLLNSDAYIYIDTQIIALYRAIFFISTNVRTLQVNDQKFAEKSETNLGGSSTHEIE